LKLPLGHPPLLPRQHFLACHLNMADVDMTDAPGAAAPISKKKGGAAAGGDNKVDGKKRFEVKKVREVRQLRGCRADTVVSGTR
jgi:hypothetical protein